MKDYLNNKVKELERDLQTVMSDSMMMQIKAKLELCEELILKLDEL